ncbi:hypothetical protein, partial [Xanthomonas campestris]|uniref:hypothetical protein n=1 Tax=Xanthomonas campestris TaxID=339 RepID=UPI0032E4ABFD
MPGADNSGNVLHAQDDPVFQQDFCGFLRISSLDAVRMPTRRSLANESPLKNPLQAPSVIGDSGTALKDGHP